MTPPVAPKMAPPPVAVAKGLSNSSSGSSVNLMPAVLIMRANSRVVMAASTSSFISSRVHSYFLAVQGMTLTTYRFLGSMPFFSHQ